MRHKPDALTLTDGVLIRFKGQKKNEEKNMRPNLHHSGGAPFADEQNFAQNAVFALLVFWVLDRDR